MATLAELIAQRRGTDSDQHVADIVGVGQTTISRWRRGVRWPEPENYAPLAAWLGLPFEELATLVEVERVEAGVTQSDERAARLALQRLVVRMDATIASLRDELRAQAERTDQRFDSLEAALHQRFRRAAAPGGPPGPSASAGRRSN